MDIDNGKTVAPSAFATLLNRTVPHILEKIFLSLDYESFKTSMEVDKNWRGHLTSDTFLIKAKSTFPNEILTDENKY